MLEYLAIPAIALGAALFPKRKKKDHMKIQQVIENRKVGIKVGEEIKYPKLIRQHHNEIYSTYIYNLPYGIPSDAFEALCPAISEAVSKEVDFEFEDGVLKLNVYHQKLPDKWNYDESLLRPGKWEVPIGRNHKGVLFHDFEKYPHMLVGGVTRFGKTVLMKEFLNSLIVNNPDNVEIYILDLKAGLEFYKFKALPQVKEVACDVYESAEVLNTIIEELHEKEVHFRNMGFTNIQDTPIKKRTFIFVDEGAELSPNIVKDKRAKKYAEFCQGALSEIARISGGLGYRLIYGTQYPTKEAVPMQVKMNIVARLSFICASQVASRVLLDATGAEELPSIPGRAIYLVEKARTVQVPYIDDKMMFKMMEDREDDILKAGKDRKPIDDDQPPGSGENLTPTEDTQPKVL